MNPPNHSPSPSPLFPLLTLLTSTTLYPLLFYLSIPRPLNPARFGQSRQALSTLHSSLLTSLSLAALGRFLRSQAWWRGQGVSRERADAGVDRGRGGWGFGGGGGDVAGVEGAGVQTRHPLIAARSGVANCLAAWEAGYLLQDTVLLVVGQRMGRGGVEGLVARGVDARLQAVHHVGVGGALAVLMCYVARGRERGVWVVVMFLLMNASTPLLNLRWYLINFQPCRRRVLEAVNAAFLVVFPVCRIYLIWYVLELYGTYYGESAVETFKKRLLLPCRWGTGSLAVMNMLWWITAVRKTVRRGSWFVGREKNG